MSYNILADYSEVSGGKILPFKFELDVPNCIFVPGTENYQKFSYIITAKGGGNTEHLASFILGIDENIEANQIKNISVIINGVSQSIKFNVPNPNVSLTGSGLKFDFRLNKNNDIMKFSFELITAYEVGSIPVILYGNSVTKTGLTIGGPFTVLNLSDMDDENSDDDDSGDENFDDDDFGDDDSDDDDFGDDDSGDENSDDDDSGDENSDDDDSGDENSDDNDFGDENSDDDDSDDDDSGDENSDDEAPCKKKCYGAVSCEKFTYKVFELSVPVSIKPFAIPHVPNVMCIGDVITYPGIKECSKNCKSFDFTLTEKIGVKIPVEFGANTCFGKLCTEECADENDDTCLI